MRLPFRLGLLGKFAIASAVPLLAMGLVLGTYLAHRVRDRTLAQASTSADLIARLGFQSQITGKELAAGKLNKSHQEALDSALTTKKLDDGLARIKIWNKRGTVVYSDKKNQVGNNYQLFPELHSALTGKTVATVTNLSSAEVVSGQQAGGKVLEIYVPIEKVDNAPPLGAINFFLPYGPIAKEISHEQRTLYMLLLGGIGLVWLVLFRIVAGASKRLRRQSEELELHADQKEYQALHDPLTELPNRALFGERIQYALYDAHDEGKDVAVLLMDLDRFKEINDTLGHHYGDLLLQELGSRLQQALRESDTVARLGGDEFGVLLPSLPDRRVVNEVVERIRTAVEEPFILNNLPLAIETSIGVSIYPEHGEDVDTLMQRADVAMYQAKKKNSLFEVYDEQQDEYDPSRLTLVGELRRAIDERELEVFYQPKAILSNGDVEGVEALVRWIHPERGLLPPDEFIPLAEHTGLIGPLTLYVLDEALEQCREWRDAGMNMSVAVNMAMRNLLDLNFPDRVTETLAEVAARADGARARDHREHDHGRPVPRHVGAAPPQRDGREAVDRRLRYRLLVARVSEAAARRRGEDRQVVRSRHVGGRQRRRDRPLDDRPGPQPRAAGGRRRRGDERHLDGAARPRVRPGAGLPDQQACAR